MKWYQDIVARIGIDKIAHFFGSAFVCLALARFVNPVIAAAITLSLGIAKEVLDKANGGRMDGKDLMADALGIILGALIGII